MRSFLLLAVLAGCGPPARAGFEDGAAFRHGEEFLHAYHELDGDDRKEYDPLSVIAMKPGQRWSFEWPEHPAGWIQRATNTRGLNQERETSRAKSGLRILATGDSHTEGVVSNGESFTSVLERLLHEERGLRAEVLNAGVGYTGPHCHLGVLRKYLELAPDVFVAVFFSGNDFMDDLRVAYLSGAPGDPRPDESYYEPLRAAEKAWSAACWQGVNQAYRFRRFPEERARALEAVEGSFAAMQALCAERGILFVAVILPTRYDVDLTEQREEFRRLAEHLGLEPEDMAANERMASELGARLRARGIEVLDVTEPFRAEPAPLYWKRDHHLSLRGHALLAELLLAKLAGILPPP